MAGTIFGNRPWQALSGLWGNFRVRQAATLYAASFAGIPLSIFTSMVFTRFLGPEGFGDFAFLDSLFDFARIIFPFGFFYAGNRALVLNRDGNKAREYYGATLVYLFLLFAVMALCMLVYGLLDTNLADKGLTGFYLALLPFGWIFLLTPYFDNMLHADNRIHALAAVRFLPKVITFAAALIIFYYLGSHTGNRLAIVWPVYLFAFASVYLLVFIRLRISFKNLRQRMRAIWQHNKTYGLHLYTGMLFSAGSLSLSGILISYFSPSNAGVGFFVLAMAIARPLALVPGVIATTWYKDFAGQNKASFRLILITLAMTFTAFAGLFLVSGPFIRLFYTAEFLPVVPLIHLSGVGMLLYGLASFFNRFLEAHGRGRSVRNTYIAMGTTLLVLNLLLIPTYGATGAALAVIVSNTVYLLGMGWSYLKLTKTTTP